jgi:dihydrodipicolinate synthase/N-acetylneuraminate lyase
LAPFRPNHDTFSLLPFRFSSMTTHTQGLIAAALTPFDADGELASERVPDLRDFLKSRGVAGVFIGGTTGEWPSLTTAERLQLAQPCPRTRRCLGTVMK